MPRSALQLVLPIFQMDPVFLDGAAFPPITVPQPVFLGLQLVPYSLGHHALLMARGNPLVCGGAIARKDWCDAIFICSQPWRRSARDLAAWWLPLYSKLWHWRMRRCKFDEELLAFREHLFSCIRCAEFKLNESAGQEGVSRVCGAPVFWVLLIFALTALRLDREAALDLTFVNASALYAAWMDFEGRAELVSEADREFMRFAAAEDAKRFHPDGRRKEPAA